ncbi:MAG TPA: membrane protein insertase YidC [Cyclobacteriaceae bacterium]|nr:membrane protein insertase YidC [Cyclobacteriaceae bacterium]
MDRNSAIGLTLMAFVLLGYFYFFSPTPEPPKPKQITGTISSPKDTLAQKNSAPAIDSATAKQFGDLGSFLIGKEEFTSIENDVLNLTFSNHAIVSAVNLKTFKTYTQKPLFLSKDGNNQFSLIAMHNGKMIDLYQLHYQVATTKDTDTTRIAFTANVSESAYIKHIYSIPSKGYQLGYRIETKGVSLDGKDLSFAWIDNIPLVEKDIADVRNRTTINYYSAQGSFGGLSDGGPDNESITEPTKWVAIKQKFFITSIIAKNQFGAATLSTLMNAQDSSVVKRAEINLAIPSATLSSGKADFTYYFGPNDYRITKDVTDGFSRNMALGWPPVIWINKFVVMPVFIFLQGIISNYGIVIMLLVLFMKLLLTPLTYKSMLAAAKMRLLKPEADVIDQKYPDNLPQAQQEKMKLYQQAGASPFSGCMPLLLQTPILFSLFYLFPNSIDLRQKGFLWAEDLSTYDSILNLPFSIPFYGSHVSLFVLLMTASQLIYSWQNNQIQSVQGPMKSMGYVMPVMFMFILNSFSAGLSFYYFISNLITFAQQAIIKRFVDEDKIMAIMNENRKNAALGKTKKSKFMAKLEDAMKASEEARKKGKK